MIRRLQLLEPGEHRFRRAAALGGRIREVLLHDNKVIPGVLGVLALLVFAWFLAGALMGSPGKEEGQQASGQSSLSQTPEEDQGATPAPEAENRDVDSFAAFTPKDPFRRILSPAPKEGAGGSTRPTAGGASKSGGNQKAGATSAGGKASPGGGGQKAGTNAGGKASPGGGGAGGSTSGGGSGAKSARPGGAGGSTSGGNGGSVLGAGGGASQGGNGGLFNSGGDLPLP